MIFDPLDRLIQDAERNEIVHRARVTLAVQTTLADRWMWEQKDLAAWEADIHDVTSMESTTSFGQFFAAEGALNDVELDLRRALAALHDATVRGVGAARIRWREVPDRRPLVARMRARATTPQGILEEALAWEVAWQKIEPGFVPVPGLTLAGFVAQHAAVRALERPRAEAALERRLAAGRLGVALDALNTDLQRWYAVATATFYDPESNGRALLDTVPTTFVPRYAKAARERRAAKRAAAKAAAAGGVAENVSGAADAAAGTV
jgi:hypothetical protein